MGRAQRHGLGKVVLTGREMLWGSKPLKKRRAGGTGRVS